jgi:hypothetical protein
VRWRIWERWLSAGGAWKGWSVCPALLAPEADDIRPRSVVASGTNLIVDALAGQLTIGGTCVLLDMEPTVGIHVAARLNQMRLANVVLVLPRWPYIQGVLPVDGLLQALISQSARLVAEDRLPNVVFVVDAQRSIHLQRKSKTEARADNRYRLNASDLPNLAVLRARNVHRILKISST